MGVLLTGYIADMSVRLLTTFEFLNVDSIQKWHRTLKAFKKAARLLSL